MPALAILLIVAWLALWLGFKIVSGVVHLLVVVAIVLLVVHFLKRGASKVSGRG